MGSQRILLTDCTDCKCQSGVIYGLLIKFVWDASQIQSLWKPDTFRFDFI